MKKVRIMSSRRFNRTNAANPFLFMLLAVILTAPSELFAQNGIPSGSCGIEYIYDAAGNMAERRYVCNNSAGGITSLQSMKATGHSNTLQAVSALYPNPTNGRFTVHMVNPLHDARVEITNVQGSVISRSTVSGSLLSFDLSGKAAGTYFIQIYDNGTVLSAQVVKQ